MKPSPSCQITGQPTCHGSESKGAPPVGSVIRTNGATSRLMPPTVDTAAHTCERLARNVSSTVSRIDPQSCRQRRRTLETARRLPEAERSVERVSAIRGGGGNRTRVKGFADLCLGHSATPPERTMVSEAASAACVLGAGSQRDDDALAGAAVGQEAGVHDWLEALGRHGTGPQPAHRRVAAELAQPDCLLAPLHAFGGHFHAERVA